MQTDLFKTTKKSKVLQALKLAGGDGVSNWDLNQITFRYSAVIHDLRQEGWLIDTVKLNSDGGYKFIMRGKI
jgi:hypothetical protein